MSKWAKSGVLVHARRNGQRLLATFVASALVLTITALVPLPAGAQPPLDNGGGWTTYPDPDETTTRERTGQRLNGEIPLSPGPTGFLHNLVDLEAAFNNARNIENLDLCPGVIQVGAACADGAVLMPTTFAFPAGYELLSYNDRALWLLNSEREARGLLPLDDADISVTMVAQDWADNLGDNRTFFHNSGRVAALNTICSDCDGDFGALMAENLASRRLVLTGEGLSTSFMDDFGVELAMYNWMYNDRNQGNDLQPDQRWGHRHALLWDSFTNDYDDAATEGFLGIAVARDTVVTRNVNNLVTRLDEYEVVVLNMIDPAPAFPGPGSDYPPDPETGGEVGTEERKLIGEVRVDERSLQQPLVILVGLLAATAGAAALRRRATV